MKDILKRHSKIVLAVLGVILIGGSVYASAKMLSPKAGDFQVATAEEKNLTETISTEGKVTAAQNVSLSFERSGKVSYVGANVGATVKAGDVIASLDASDLNAELRQAQSALQTARLKLQSLQGAGSGAMGSDVGVSISNSLSNLKDKIVDSYVKADSAMGTYVDQLFSNPQSDTPDFGITISSGSTRYSIKGTASEELNINSEKRQIDAELAAWQSANASLADETAIMNADAKGKAALESYREFLADLAAVVNSYVPSDTSAATVYGTYQTGVAAARASVDTAISNLTSAEEQYNSSKAGASPYQISLQQAAVASAEAQVDGIQAEIAKTTLRSPLDGLITTQDAKVGEVVSPGTVVASVISNGNFQIETYVSEADIANVKAGQKATITLDAYGSSAPFGATVVSVDPAETFTNGVGAYKTTLQFDAADERIKEGLAANVSIIAAEAQNALAVPATAIITRGSDTFVLAADSSGNFTERKVTTGLRSADGYTEIRDGLSAGESVATFGNQ